MNVGKYLRGEDLHVGTSRITKPKELKMNERIKRLAEQAGFEITPWGNESVPCVHQAGPIDVELEKFAELIVAECARVIVNGGYWSGGPLGPKRQCTPPEIATMIKEHFGVEK